MNPADVQELVFDEPWRRSNRANSSENIPTLRCPKLKRGNQSARAFRRARPGAVTSPLVRRPRLRRTTGGISANKPDVPGGGGFDAAPPKGTVITAMPAAGRSTAMEFSQRFSATLDGYCLMEPRRESPPYAPSDETPGCGPYHRPRIVPPGICRAARFAERLRQLHALRLRMPFWINQPTQRPPPHPSVHHRLVCDGIYRSRKRGASSLASQSAICRVSRGTGRSSQSAWPTCRFMQCVPIADATFSRSTRLMGCQIGEACVCQPVLSSQRFQVHDRML